MKLPEHFFLAVTLAAALMLPPAATAHSAPPAQQAPSDLVLPSEETAAAAFPLGAAGLPFEGPHLIRGNAPGAHSVMTADLDGDGDLDVISAERGETDTSSGHVFWFRNSGGASPTFEPHLIADVAGSYLALPADLNADGKVDIVVAAVAEVDPSSVSQDGVASPSASGAVYWFQNDGQQFPTFAQRTVAAGLAYSVAAAVEDLDGDGDNDVVVAARDDSTIRWYASSGGAVPTFTPRVLFTGADGPVSVTTGDVDGDGDPDVVTAAENHDRIYWHANDGAGNFTPFPIRMGNPLGILDFAKSVRLADLEGDGDLDVVYASEDHNQVGIYLNNGARPPQFTERILGTDRIHIKYVDAADMDRDGDLDVLTASSDDDAVAWYRNNGAADPQFAPFVVTNGADGARFVHAADLDNDGDLDLLAASRNDGRITWFRNRLLHRTAHFPPSSQHTLGIFPRARHIHAADLDGDGDRDIITVSREFIWHENNGAIPAAFTPHTIPTTVSGGRWIDSGDVDSDGDMDLIVASNDNDTYFWFENNGAPVPTFTERIVAQNSLGPRAVLSGDLDLDGDLDIFGASDGKEEGGQSRVLWFENNGATPPAFVSHVVEKDIGYARSVFPVDMDKDGDLDLLATDQTSGDVSVLVYENQRGNPLTFVRRIVGRAGGAQHVHAGDMDRDGDPDVLVSSEFDNSIRIFWNLDGRGQKFSAQLVDGGASAVHAAITADVDGDGDQDIAAALEAANQIVWYENNGQPQPGFTRRMLYDQAFIAHAVSAADVDSDGDVDILGAARGSGVTIWLENLGGQFRYFDGGAFQVAGVQGRPRIVRPLTLTHLGRPADPALQPWRLDIRLLNDQGKPLSADEAATRVANLSLWADQNRNGNLDGQDLLLGAESEMNKVSGGSIIVTTNVTTPPAVPPGASAMVLVVADMTGVCGAGGVQMNIRLTGQTAVDVLAGSPLLAESMATITSGPPEVVVDAPRQLRINEVSANPSVVDDWLEIYNTGNVAVNMTGMYLTDDLENPTKHRIPDGVVIPPQSYLIFIADDENGPLHLKFGLSSAGESLALFDTDARGNRVLDSITYGRQDPDQTSGRLPDGGTTWRTLPGATRAGPNVLGGMTDRILLPMISKSFGC